MSGEGSNSGSVSAVPPHSPTRASAQNSHSTVTMWLLNTGRFTNTATAATRGDLRRCKEGLGSREWEKKCVCSCSWLAERQEYQTANERAPWHLPQEYFSPCLTASAAPQFDIKYAVSTRELWQEKRVLIQVLCTGQYTFHREDTWVYSREAALWLWQAFGEFDPADTIFSAYP